MVITSLGWMLSALLKEDEGSVKPDSATLAAVLQQTGSNDEPALQPTSHTGISQCFILFFIYKKKSARPLSRYDFT